MIEKKQVNLDEYEKWIESELEKGNFLPVENFEEWKMALEEAARRALERDRKVRITLEFSSPEQAEKAVELLKKHFGKELRVVS